MFVNRVKKRCGFFLCKVFLMVAVGTMVGLIAACNTTQDQTIWSTDVGEGEGNSDGDGDSDSDGDGDGDADSDSDGDADGDGDGDADDDADFECVDLDSDWWCEGLDCDDNDPSIHPNQIETPDNGVDDDCDGVVDEIDGAAVIGEETVKGTVMAPSANYPPPHTPFPISGALVYVTDTMPGPIPDEAFCYECDELNGKAWTLSGADGSFVISNAPAGDLFIVTRKGLFRRVRPITIVEGEINDVPMEDTTLPSKNDGEADRIPNFAVVLDDYDLPEDMLAKMGMGDLDDQGHLDRSQPFYFDLYARSTGEPESSGASEFIFSSQGYLNHYHMLFMPCISAGESMPGTKIPKAANFSDQLQQYISDGGKLYASCWASQWAEQTFPEVIDFRGDDNVGPAGDVGEYSTKGTIDDPEMQAWLAVVAGDEDTSNYPIEGAFIVMDDLTDGAYEGHGLEEDDGMVVPKTWVTDLGSGISPEGAPLTVTYNYDCGKVFYSSFQVVESSPSVKIRPQEWVLIYLFFEVGVCEAGINIE